MVNPVHKGKRGEVEFCKWLDKNLGFEDTERNYNQSQGGADVIVKDFIVEVKRRETLNFVDWWYQVSMAKKEHKEQDLIPVVAFRQNNKKWEFLIPAEYIGVEKGFIRITEIVFKKWALNIIAGKPNPSLIEN